MNDITYTTTPQVSLDVENNKSNWKSDDITELAMALSKAQAEIEGATTNSTNPFYKSSYADLHQVIKSSMPYLTKHGLSVIQGTEDNSAMSWAKGKIHVTTILCHSSGQWIKSSVAMPIGEKKDAQAIGTAVTYGRRYGLSAMVGIAQYDDDAQSISAPPKKTKKAKPLSTEELNNTDNEILNL